MFIKTETILDRILATKQQVVERMLAQPDALATLEAAAEAATPPHNFRTAVQREQVALIAEVKKASPSKGILIDPFDPQGLAEIYAANGAAAISVLTDEPFFQGHLDHLRQVHSCVDVPVLRKDFVIHPLQVLEARAAGADAVLLIVMALEQSILTGLYQHIRGWGMTALVEVHNASELDRALAAGADVIGVNNRDLRTFEENLELTETLAQDLPHNVILVAESAIRSIADVRRMGDCGANAVLVGEGLVKAGDIGAQVRAFSSQPRRPRVAL